MKYFGIHWTVWQIWVGCFLSGISAASSFQQLPTTRTATTAARRSVVDFAPTLISAPRSTGDTMKKSNLSQTRGGGDESSNQQESSSVDNEMNPIVSLIGGTTSAVVSATFYGVLAWKRDGLMVAVFLGAIANAIMSKVLKKVIAQTRPEGLDLSDKVRLKPSDGGMPSSHAMSLGFIGTFTILHLTSWWTILPIATFSTLSLLYRIQVKLHTWEQVAVGLIVGSSNAYLFHSFAEEGMIQWLTRFVLNEEGLLPLPLLVVPAIVGALIVGSVERRIGNWLKRRKENAKAY